MPVDKRRSNPGSACIRIPRGNAAGNPRIGSIDFGEVEVREIRNQPRDVSAGSVRLNRADRVPIVLNNVDHRQLLLAVFSDSQNSPWMSSLLQSQTNTTSSPWKVTSRYRGNLPAPSPLPPDAG